MDWSKLFPVARYAYKKEPEKTALAVAATGTILGGPAVGSGILAAHAATQKANADKLAKNALHAAASERGQNPALFGQGIELGGELEFGAGTGLQAMIPFAIIGIIAFYVIFKD